MIEVNQVINDDSGVGRYLEKNGDGLHHICLESDNLDADLEMLKPLGYDLIKPIGSNDYGFRVGWIHPKQAQGVLIELGKPQGQTRHLPLIATALVTRTTRPSWRPL